MLLGAYFGLWDPFQTPKAPDWICRVCQKRKGGAPARHAVKVRGLGLAYWPRGALACSICQFSCINTLKPILGGLPGSVCSSRSVARAGPPGCCSWKCTAHAPVLCSASCLCRRVPKASTARRLPPYAPPLSADPCLFPIWGCRVGRCWEHFCTYGGVGAGNKSSHLGKYPGVGLLLGHRVNCSYLTSLTGSYFCFKSFPK